MITFCLSDEWEEEEQKRRRKKEPPILSIGLYFKTGSITFKVCNDEILPCTAYKHDLKCPSDISTKSIHQKIIMK